MYDLRRRFDKRERKQTTASDSCQKYAPVVPLSVPSEPSNPNLFLKRMSDEFVETLYTQMISPKLVSHANPKNLVYITADHLKILKSPNEKNGRYPHLFENYNEFVFIIGAFILEWLSCKMTSQDITNPSKKYAHVTLTGFCNARKIKCEKFQTEKDTIMRELNISKISLKTSHVVLRRKISAMPILMDSERKTQGKFFQVSLYFI